MYGKHGTDPELVVNVKVTISNVGYTSNNAHRTGYFTAHLTFILKNDDTVEENAVITGITLTNKTRIKKFTIGKYEVTVDITAITNDTTAAPQMQIIGATAKIISIAYIG